MNENTVNNTLKLNIPTGVYQSIKQCPFCRSVYLTDNQCEACGRSLVHRPLGEPFGHKSYYGLKERYIESLDFFTKLYPQLEDVHTDNSRRFQRHLMKRLSDILAGFAGEEVIERSERKFFYVEVFAIIDELILYGVASERIQIEIEESAEGLGPLLTGDLLLYLSKSKSSIRPFEKWYSKLLNFRILGILKIGFTLKIVIFYALIVHFSYTFYEQISWQFYK